MRAARFLLPLSLLALTSSVRSQTAPPTPSAPTVTVGSIGVPEAEVRSGPSPMFYATSRLRQGERVDVVEEVPGGWLKIAPPPGSFSWISARLVEPLNKTTAVVESIADAPVRIGSSLTDIEPTVEQVKLQRGAQVVIVGEPFIAPDGTKWWRIAPPKQEVRYVLKDAVRMTPPVETVVSSAAPGNPPPAAAPIAVDPLWTQAEQAERAGNVPAAILLYEQLAAKQPIDHDMQMRCYTRIQYLREGNHIATAGAVTPIPPVIGGSAVPGQPVGYVPPQPPPMQTSGPGMLARAGFYVDGRPAYALTDSAGRLLMYATAQQGLNLDLFVNHGVELLGTVTARTDLRSNYIVVGQVRQLQ